MLLFARIPTVFRLRCQCQKGIKRGSVTPVNRGQRSDLAQCQKGSKSSALGAPSSPRLPSSLRLRRDETARQATQEPPSHKAAARQGNQLRFGPACSIIISPNRIALGCELIGLSWPIKQTLSFIARASMPAGYAEARNIVFPEVASAIR
jgi:hypothetical protein